MNRILASLNIGRRIILGFSLLILLFLLAMITVEVAGIPGTTVKGKFAATRDQNLSDLELTSGLLAERIASWFVERRIDVDGLTVSPMLRKAIESRKAQPEPGITDELKAFLKSHTDIDSVTILDPADATVLASSRTVKNTGSSADTGITPDKFSRFVVPGYQETIEIILGHDNRSHVRIVRQMFSTGSSQRIIALLVAESDLGQALRPLIWSVRNNIVSHNWECVIASTVGSSISQFRVGKTGIKLLNAPLSGISKSAPISLALAGIHGPYEGQDQFGNNVLAFHRQITVDRGTALGLVLKVESAFAYKAARSNLIIQILLWLALFGVGFVLCFFLVRQIVSPLKALAAVAKKIEGGDLTARAAVIDQTEVGQLAAVFNGMAAKIEISQNELEALVENRTRDLKSAQERLQEQYEELQVNEEKLRSQNDELLSAEETLRASEEQYRQLVYNLAAGIVVHAPDSSIIFANPAALTLLGLSKEQIKGKAAIDPYWCFLRENGSIMPIDEYPVNQVLSSGAQLSGFTVGVRRPELIDPVWVLCNAYPVFSNSDQLRQVVVTFTDISERKQAEAALSKRIDSLTQPLESATVSFDELFNIDEVQRLQDEFARATGVASIITDPDGIPLTAPSNFTHLCNDIIRKTEKGCASCYKSDAALGRFNPDGPNIQTCLSGGLWDAGAGITVGGQHIANWLIGQVRDETQSEEKMAAYAREIGVDEASFLDAFREVPAMSQTQFANIAQALFTLANQLSSTAYQNIQQARFISERKQAEEQLLSLTQRLKLATSSAHLGIWDWNVKENTMVWDDRMFELYGITRQSFPNSIDAWMNGLHPEDRETAIAECQAALSGEKEFDTGFRIMHPDGTVKHIKGKGLVLRGEDGNPERMLGINYDVTDAKQAEEEKYKLESQLQQAQKLESVGRLAGGVAHDFNNMLSVILGHAELGLMKIAPDDPLVADLKEISRTADRSADLTRQLLSFARKQTVSPKIIDLNETVTNMLRMLQRLIGEDIQLIWQPSHDQCQIKMDPSQIDQILANLCVNARDAIADTGRITIETGTCSIDSDYCAANPEATPGEYVRLVVSDDGKGMDRDTLAHAFEPFYTTKEMGKGTGLGLATVYGVVKQNNGFINIYSEPGKGTTFSIHLPHYAGDIGQKPAEADSQTVPRGRETILLVEDEAAILNIAAIMLEKQGYTVLRGDSPGRAMELAREHNGAIHLLMTDVIMPGMNGRDLARNLLSVYPDMKRLFMSGYTADVIAHHGVLDDGVHFIQKPFSLPNMAAKVREVLDGE